MSQTEEGSRREKVLRAAVVAPVAVAAVSTIVFKNWAVVLAAMAVGGVAVIAYAAVEPEARQREPSLALRLLLMGLFVVGPFLILAAFLAFDGSTTVMLTGFALATLGVVLALARSLTRGSG